MQCASKLRVSIFVLSQAPVVPPSSTVSTQPHLLIHPGYDGSFDFSLVGTADRPISRLTISVDDSETPALYAELFEDCFADEGGLEEQFVEWFSTARPFPDCRVALPTGDEILASSDIIDGCSARLALDIRRGKVVQSHRVEIPATGGMEESDFVPLGGSLIFIVALKKLGRVANTSIHQFGAEDSGNLTPGAWAARPVFQPKDVVERRIAEFNESRPRLKSGLSPEMSLLVGGQPKAPESVHQPVAITISPRSSGQEAAIRVQSPQPWIDEIFQRIGASAERFQRLMAAGAAFAPLAQFCGKFYRSKAGSAGRRSSLLGCCRARCFRNIGKPARPPGFSMLSRRASGPPTGSSWAPPTILRDGSSATQKDSIKPYRPSA